MNQQFQLYQGDCINILPKIESASVDAVVSDPIYPEIDRDYGRMSESEWMEMMQEVVRQTRRILKPTGSAVFVLQPNSERVGRMRSWLWKFMAWCCDEWNIVQDAYWWNIAAIPTQGSTTADLLRPSLKPCVWLGSPNCYRNQNKVLWNESDCMTAERMSKRSRVGRYDKAASGHSVERKRMADAAIRRGGVTPFNVIPVATSNGAESAGAHGHGAGTPQQLSDWWMRYICPAGGVAADWFLGSGTMGLSAMKYGCQFIGIEQKSEYFDIALRRITEASRDAKGLPVQLAGAESDYADAPLFAGL